MARPTGWDILGLDGDPTPGVVESVQALAKEFGDFAHDVESAYRSLNSFGSDANALQWVGQTADAFKDQFGPLPGRLQKLYTSYSEASDALSAYAPKLQAAQSKADAALRQAQDAHADLQRATTAANTAAADLKTAQQNHAANPNPQAVTDAQTAHDTAQTSLNNAKARMADLAKQANDAYNDRINAAKACASALHHAQSDGIHNKSWWDHVAEDLSEWGGKIAEIANDLAPFLDVLALATSWIPGVDVVTAALAEADNIIALVGTGMQIAGDAMQGHWGDALLGAGMLGLQFAGGRLLGKLGGEAEGEERGLVNSVEGGAKNEEGAIGTEARTADGVSSSCKGGDPVDLVSGEMVTAEIDLELPGILPVVLRRAYASGYDTGRLFGPGWSSTLDQRVSINAAGIHFAGDDGQVLHYDMPSADEQVLPSRGARWPLTWDRELDEIRITDPQAGLTRLFPAVHYNDEFGQIRDLAAITDRNDNRISILRDEHGTPTALEHPAYRLAFDTTLTGAGLRLTGIKLLTGGPEASSTVKEYTYDARGRLKEVIDSTGHPYTYEWDDHGRITAWVNRVGYRYAYEYGQDGRVARGIGTGGYLSASFEYNDEERTTVLTDSLGHRTTYRYDEYGHIAAITDPAGNTTITQYDRDGRVLSRTDPLGARTLYERDLNGDIVRLTAPDGAVTEVERNAFHKVTVARMPDGGVWSRKYDERGNLIAVVDPAGATHTFTYGPGGVPTGGSDPLGAPVRIEANTAGLPIAVTDPAGATTRAERDEFGRVVAVVDPLGGRTEMGWTPLGQLAWRITPDGARTAWTYDAEGQRLSVSDPTGSMTRFEPGPFGRLIARTSPDGLRHDFVYDTELRLVEVSNAGGGVWQYRFDSAGRLQSETDFIGRTLTYEHDAAGRLIGRTTGSQERITIDRDAVGRTVRRRSAHGTFVYRYDPVGRLIAATGPGTALEYGRDRLGRVLTETVNGRTTAFAYDAAGHRVHRVTPSGAASAWSFNSTGRAVSLEAGDGSLAFSYDAAGGEIERALGPGAWLSFEFDPAGRLSAQQLYVSDRSGRDGSEHSQTRVLDRNWVWGADGVPAEVRDSRTGTRRFTTDSLGRVTGVSGDSWNEEYAYDTFGNVAYGETDANDVGRRDIEKTLVRAAGRTSYERDTAGRLIRTVRRTLDGRRKTWQYTWDAYDRLIQAVGPNGVAWRYSYDPLGRRTSKARLLPDGSVAEEILFVWDGVRVAEQCSVSDDGVLTAVTWDYEPDAFRPAAQRRRTMLAAAPQHVIDEAFYAIITDLVGTPTELVTADGRIAWQTTNSLWGRTVSISADADVDCPLRFPGQYYDAETGFHYNLNRYYDPEIASYITPDPLGLAPSPNDHAYVSNPMVEFDPLGLQCVPTNIGNADLPIHPDIDKFYVRAGELVDNRVETHGLNELQMLGGEEVGHGGVSNLANDELIVPGGPQGNDPISGYRDWAPGDSGNYPASRIVITGGHHRTAEVVSRVLSGDMDPSTLIEFAIRR